VIGRFVNAVGPRSSLVRAMATDELRTALDVLDWWLTDDRVSDRSMARMRAARDDVRAELARRAPKGARHDA